MIEKICNEFNVKCYSTLTGFKYIAQLIREKPNEKFIAGGEESYGYLVDDFVRDKDAVISSAIICEIANWCKNKNEDLTDFLNFIYKKYGFYFEKLHTIKLDGVKGKKKINKIMIILQNASFVREKIFDSNNFLKSIAKPIDPKIITPTEAKSSNLIKAELRYNAVIPIISAKTRLSVLRSIVFLEKRNQIPIKAKIMKTDKSV